MYGDLIPGAFLTYILDLCRRDVHDNAARESGDLTAIAIKTTSKGGRRSTHP